MATVYLARDLKHERLVALKVLAPELAATLGPERFIREIRLTARLDHPHILSILDSGEDAGRLWYTMPYVEGESLHDRLRRETQLPVAEAVRLAGEVAEALEYAHGRGIVHRDIKPQNILLSQGHARVADFGVARAADSDGDSLTATGLAVGTPAYMAPEQAAGGKADARSDLYSLGCVLYEMLAGEPPFTGPSAQAIITKRTVGPVPSVRLTRPDVPPGLDALITQALSPVPAARPTSAAEFAAALRQGLSASIAGTRPAGHPGARRMAIAAGIVALLIAGAALLWRAGTRQTPADAAERMIAVLPLKNLGAPADAAFADGLTEELTSRLALIGGLGVISRTSADQYRDSRKTIREIGRELGAGYVLEGSVRWDRRGDSTRIRVTPQLIEVGADRHLWTDQYDAALVDVFRVQSDIAQRVAAALHVTLRGKEQAALDQRPTANFDAYTLYLQAMAAKGSDAPARQRRLELLERAVALDSSFALARARMAITHLQLYGSLTDVSSTRLQLGRREAEAALRLAPDLPDTRLALALLYWLGDEQPDRAAEEFRRALDLQPSETSALMGLGHVSASAGRWDDAVEVWERMALLDPQSIRAALTVVDAHRFRRDYPAARRYLDRALAIGADEPDVYLEGPMLELALRGDTAAGFRPLREAVGRFGYGKLAASLLGGVLLQLPEPAFRDSARSVTATTLGGAALQYHFWQLEAALARGDSAAVRAHADSAAAPLTPEALSLPTMGVHMRSVAALLAAYRGRPAEAREHLAVLEREDPLGDDAYSGQMPAINVARAYAVIGDPSAATRHLERLLLVPSEITVPLLRSDPAWKPLRGYLPFERLLR